VCRFDSDVQIDAGSWHGSFSLESRVASAEIYACAVPAIITTLDLDRN
jgi:hypothetical protein